MAVPVCTSSLDVKKILCATDFSVASDAVFHIALQLCFRLEASLTILNVFEYKNISAPEEGGRLLASDAEYKNADPAMRGLVLRAVSAGIHCKGITACGTAPSCIVDTQQLEQSNLVVLGTRSIHGFERLVFGSTAEAVLRSVPCSVLTVGPLAARETFDLQVTDGIALFATDFHTTTRSALRSAASIASKLHLRLHCLHVLPRGVQEGVVPLIIKEGLQYLASDLDSKCEAPICAVTYGSEVSGAVVAYARLHSAKLIVLGVRRASLVATHVPAHIAYRIISEAPCAVMTIAFEPQRSSTTQSLLETANPKTSYRQSGSPSLP